MQVLIIIYNQKICGIIFSNSINLASYLYYRVLNIKKPYQKVEKMLKNTKIINFYNNKHEK